MRRNDNEKNSSIESDYGWEDNGKTQFAGGQYTLNPIESRLNALSLPKIMTTETQQQPEKLAT